jgi:hypothetical protein
VGQALARAVGVGLFALVSLRSGSAAFVKSRPTLKGKKIAAGDGSTYGGETDVSGVNLLLAAAGD